MIHSWESVKELPENLKKHQINNIIQHRKINIYTHLKESRMFRISEAEYGGYGSKLLIIKKVSKFFLELMKISHFLFLDKYKEIHP